MKKLFHLGAALAFAASLAAQPLPRVQFNRVFPKLNVYYPVWMSEAPDASGRMFIVEQGGRIIVVNKGTDGSQSNEFLNIVSRNPHAAYEEGLLSIAFHPGFKSSGLCYVYYNQEHSTIKEPFKDTLFPRMSVIPANSRCRPPIQTRWTWPPSVSSCKCRSPLPTTRVGELAFGPDGFLQLRFGRRRPGHRPVQQRAKQRLIARENNSVLRQLPANRSSAAPTSSHCPTAFPRIIRLSANRTLRSGRASMRFTHGTAQSGRYSFDRQTGQMWVVHVGQDTWEEVTVIVKGGNYGLNVFEGYHHFKPVSPAPIHRSGYESAPKVLLHNPVRQARHRLIRVIIGGYVYRGAKYPSPGQGIISTDFTLGYIYGLRYEDGKVTEYGTVFGATKTSQLCRGRGWRTLRPGLRRRPRLRSTPLPRRRRSGVVAFFAVVGDVQSR